MSQIVEAGKRDDLLQLAKSKGAKGIRFYGICFSDLRAKRKSLNWER